MSAETDPVFETANRLFGDAATHEVVNAVEAGVHPTALWELVEEAGFAAALEPDSGVSLAEALALLRAAGNHAVPIPIAETMLARRLLAGAGLSLPSGPLGLGVSARSDALGAKQVDGALRLDGALRRVPFARDCGAVVALAHGPRGAMVVCAPLSAAAVEKGRNLAGEPRDDLHFRGVALPDDAAAAAPPGMDADWLMRMAALLRTAQMVGALERVLEMSVAYANERKQFGRQIGKFQAIQHQLAALGGEVAVTAAALDMAAGAAAAAAPGAARAIAVAKARAGEAAGIAAQISHRVHGAIGFTHEFSLQLYTRRLLSWREEYGSEAYWNSRVGQEILGSNAGALWPLISTS